MGPKDSERRLRQQRNGQSEWKRMGCRWAISGLHGSVTISHPCADACWRCCPRCRVHAASPVAWRASFPLLPPADAAVWAVRQAVPSGQCRSRAGEQAWCRGVRRSGVFRWDPKTGGAATVSGLGPGPGPRLSNPLSFHLPLTPALPLEAQVLGEHSAKGTWSLRATGTGVQWKWGV